jgi:hypothetical protein
LRSKKAKNKKHQNSQCNRQRFSSVDKQMNGVEIVMHEYYLLLIFIATD